jgi:GlpG protein
MRRLLSYDDREQAQGLSDELEAQGIENQVRSDEGRHGVWITNESDLEAAREVADRYSGAPSDANRAAADRIRKQRKAGRRPVRIPGFSGGRVAYGGPVGQATLVLIVLSVAVSLLSGMGNSSSPVLRALFVVPVSPEGYYFTHIDWAQPWRLLTPMLIHFGILHLVFNMFWLYRLGSQIENIHGTRAFLGIVALTQVPGALVQFEVSGPLFGGMSGVVYGLFGFSWMQARYASKGYSLSDQDTLWIMGWFVLCATGLVGHIANAQHALGLVFGLLAGMRAYVAFRRSSAKVSFEKGSWADLNIRGFQRFKRVYFEPYVPLWFVGLAIVILFVG